MLNFVLNPGRRRRHNYEAAPGMETESVSSFSTRKRRSRRKRSGRRRKLHRRRARKACSPAVGRRMKKLRRSRKTITTTLRRLRKARKGCGRRRASGRRRKGLFSSWMSGRSSKSIYKKLYEHSPGRAASASIGFNPSRAGFRYHAKNMLGSATSAFSGSSLMSAAPIIGGMMANAYLRKTLGGLGFMPSMLRSGQMGNLGLGVVTAGLLSGIAGMAAPQYSGALLIGGLSDVVMGLVNSAMGMSNCGGCKGLGCVGCGALLAGGGADGGVYMTSSEIPMPSNIGTGLNSEAEQIMADTMGSENDDLFD